MKSNLIRYRLNLHLAKPSEPEALSCLTYGDIGSSRIVEPALKRDHSSSIAKSLQAEQVKVNLLDRPEFITWENYVYAFRTEYPCNTPALIDTMAKSYDDKSLWNLLTDTKNVESSKEMARNLQVALLNKWLGDKKPQQDVFKALGMGGTPGHPKTDLQNVPQRQHRQHVVLAHTVGQEG
ncbi:hypothetical protein PC118_g22434 [Phytophthora cactorum]|uniref:Uncharacterized protein n=2 Tax=Phytophthora cactorum TaxID=29920 RepID=A0A8T1EWV1_9STRA|nr:hypothetical protein PC118_g22434 [Phytophthora cactorum]